MSFYQLTDPQSSILLQQQNFCCRTTRANTWPMSLMSPGLLADFIQSTFVYEWLLFFTRYTEPYSTNWFHFNTSNIWRWAAILELMYRSAILGGGVRLQYHPHLLFRRHACARCFLKELFAKFSVRLFATVRLKFGEFSPCLVRRSRLHREILVHETTCIHTDCSLHEN